MELLKREKQTIVKITVSTTGMSAITKKGDNKGDINTATVYFTIDFQWVDNSGVHSRQMFDTGFLTEKLVVSMHIHLVFNC